MSCCGIGFKNSADLKNASYTSYNLSAPRLPSGLAFSSYLRPVVSNIPGNGEINFGNLGNTSYVGLSCPYLRLTTDPDLPRNLLKWAIDPEYYLFEGCACNSGFEMVMHFHYGLQVPYCVPIDLVDDRNILLKDSWILAIIVALAVAALTAATWFFVFRKGSRLQVLQNMIDIRKRMKGPPSSGTLSIVVTDIEGFSERMKEAPDAMMNALLTHNNLIHKAKNENFGHVVDQEGDSFSIAFADAGDAVKFCLQAQQLFAYQKWPKGLFREEQDMTFSGRGKSVLNSLHKKMRQMVNKRSPSVSYKQYYNINRSSYVNDDTTASPLTTDVTPRGSSGQKTEVKQRMSSSGGGGGDDAFTPVSRSRSGLLSARLFGGFGGSGGSFSSRFRSTSMMNHNNAGLSSERSVVGREASVTAASMVQRLRQSSLHRSSAGTETSFVNYNGRTNVNPVTIPGVKLDTC
ncbi:hypothetical protein CEUSTIGMA_g6174.t1 [Chlamydomonas eustigma]|uniref:Guanylate cyclase domain-containing protein n=1 Tax=Chlamydomonas eustigma TaxID=1157962 RepID=A0A250X6P4_9CHLO|nr:hypothetical protein CEUSTIGMA_g6174.t1 [Chlamydomonas eustigma]|eukprot:GAX78737.1 hypothetical protein CEUSTIGMA_g6174.t1 [Chlamydomonas eustigma]